MVLDRYFTAKTRLKTTLPALRSLRSRAKGDTAEVVVSCIESVSQLREVFRCMICGAAEYPLQALVDVLKTETGGRVVFDTMEVSQGCVTEKQCAHLGDYDAVITVFDAIDPWAGSMWRFLGMVDDRTRAKVLLVMQRCELRIDSERQAVREHMTALAQRYLGRRCDVVMVSATLAQMSGSDGASARELRERSGVERLCQALDRVLSDSSGWLEVVRCALAIGERVVEALRLEMDEVADEVEETDAICREIEQLAENALDELAGKLSSVLTKVDSEIMDILAAAEERLMHHRGEGSVAEQASALQNQIVEGVAVAADRALIAAAEQTEAHLTKCWERLARHLRDQLGAAFRPKHLKEVLWKKQRQSFLSAGRRRLQPEIDKVSIENQVAVELAKPVKARRNLKFAIVSLLVAGLGAGLLSNQWFIAAACLGASLIPTIGYRRWAKAWREASGQALWDALDHRRESIEQAMASVLKNDTTVYAEAFGAKVQQLATRAEQSRGKKVPALSDFSQLENAMAEARRSLDNSA